MKGLTKGILKSYGKNEILHGILNRDIEEEAFMDW